MPVPFLSKLGGFALAGTLAFAAHAADTGALAAQRWEANHRISFYCDLGRPVIATSDQALSVQASRDCSYSGPLDSKPPRKSLQPPFLNPRLSRAQLKSELQSRGIAIDGETPSQLRFRLATGESFTAQDVPAKSLEDPLLHLAAYPAEWGQTFVSISGAGPAALQALARAMAGSSLFWRNPHMSEEQQVRPRMMGSRRHLPVPLQPKCDLGALVSVTASMLLVGDTHTAGDARYLVKVLNARDFAWLALEISRDKRAELDAFFASSGAAEEDAHLRRVLDREPNDVMPVFMEILRIAKARRMPVLLMDYSEPYFNFPFTNTSFHGAIVGTRNQLWVSQLPAAWRGTGLVFAGLAHFTDTPGADFQNFAKDRYPGADMVFVNPLEACAGV